ncbi:hypothetical protein [Saccharothrix sp. ST-888]|uniref:hypothetical protein n=1 Tax=Saccharothrix sp. ST-888 TaxID=1427391 RepID=UPI0012E06DF1|nr:hypothetical protein [Saccharothrix sp. ST-888]
MGSASPQGGRARGGRRWWMALLAVVVVAALGGLFLWPERQKVALPPPAAPTSHSPSASPSPSKVLPYPYFLPGTCLDHPQLSTGITKAEARPCTEAHDGEAIANVVLPEGLASDLLIGRTLRELCQAPLTDWEQQQGGGGPYYGFPIGPYLKFYQQGMRDATCTMTVSEHQGGAKTTGHFRSGVPADG